MIARSALSVRGYQKICCPSVRVASVNNWFLRMGIWRVPHRFCLLAVWTFDFEGSKSEHLSKKLRAGIGRFRDHFSDPHFGTFWQHVKKQWSWFRTDSIPADGLFRAGISNWRCDVRDTFLRVLLELGSIRVLGRSPSLRAPAAHGVSSNKKHWLTL